MTAELLREQNFIDQQWQAAKSGRLFSVSNPATGAVFAQVPDSGADDARAAVEGLMVSKFRNGGQSCVCPNRVFVQDGVHDTFVEKLAARVAALRVGPASSPDSQIGPMTPDGPPVIGPTRFNNLWLSTGHGTLGWTMAAGT